MELLHCQGKPGMRYGYLISIHGIVVILANIVVADPVGNNLMAMERVVLPFVT